MSELKIWPIEEGGYLVRGTLDVRRARRAVLLTMMNIDGYSARDAIGVMRKQMAIEPGLYRTNPCSCGYEHRFDVAEAKSRGRGVFEGVNFWRKW